MAKTKRGRPTKAELEGQVLAVFLEFAEKGVDDIARYLLHVGIDNEAIDEAGGVQEAILAHYRINGGYDLNRVAYDLSRWPPIAARIQELKREQRAAAILRGVSKVGTG